MTDAPERIFLQDAGDYARAAAFEVTWCVEPQDDADTEYIRADKVAALVEEAIREGMRIATFVPIEQVQEAFDAALAELDLTPDPRVAALVDALESIEQFGSDTLSGNARGPDDRKWQRDGVFEMVKRARAALAAWKGATNDA